MQWSQLWREAPMRVIDAQAHIRGAETPDMCLGHCLPRLGKDELLLDMEAAGVDRAIIVTRIVRQSPSSLRNSISSPTSIKPG